MPAGASCDTAAFAVNAIRPRRQGEGQPGRRRPLIICGGAGGWRSRPRKDHPDRLGEETGPRIEVTHVPPGTSKRDKTGRRLFCRITRTWRARPLMTAAGAVAGTAAAVTGQGLERAAARGDGGHPDGVKVPAGQVKHPQDRVIGRAAFRSERNRAFLPQPRPAPDPARPGRLPAGVLNHPAPAGTRPQDLAALAAAPDVPPAARLCQRDRNLRESPRASAVRSTAPHGVVRQEHGTGGSPVAWDRAGPV